MAAEVATDAAVVVVVVVVGVVVVVVVVTVVVAAVAAIAVATAAAICQAEKMEATMRIASLKAVHEAGSFQLELKEA